MKFLNMLLASPVLAISVLAHATVPAPGQFVPSFCGRQDVRITDVNQLLVQQVCVGDVAGEKDRPPQPSVSFRLTDGKQEVFRIAHTSNLLIMLASGETKSLFFLESAAGQKTTMKVLRNESGKIIEVSGALVETGYDVKNFEPMVNIQ